MLVANPQSAACEGLISMFRIPHFLMILNNYVIDSMDVLDILL
jgi:hypothetical protein